MERPHKDAIETFMAVTGASEADALRMLEEHGGNLSTAVNAHFSEGDRNVTGFSAPPQHLDDDADAMEIEHLHENTSSSSLPPNVAPRVSLPEPSAPLLEPDDDDDKDVEEQILRTVIENSKREVGGDVYDLVAHQHENMLSVTAADKELPRADSLPLEIAEHVDPSEVSNRVDSVRRTSRNRRQGLVSGKAGPSRHYGDAGSLNDNDESEDPDEQPLIRRRSRRTASRKTESIESAEPSYSPLSSPRQNSTSNGFQSDEWGGLSSEEQVDSVMLEAAMFGGVPQGTSYQFAFQQNFNSESNLTPYNRVPRPLSPSFTEQRLLREQQDDEYIAALQADQEKELKALQEAEQRSLEATAAREAAIEKQKVEEEENRRKQQEEQELESELQARKSSLPQEPSPDDENALMIIVRMPDSSRHGRRFLKSDKLQLLYDFLETERIVKPRKYRLVRSYPRKAFLEEEREQPLADLGLTSKLEALFLEMI